MSDSKNKIKKISKRKLNIYRCMSAGLGLVILIISAVIILTVFIKRTSREPVDNYLVSQAITQLLIEIETKEYVEDEAFIAEDISEENMYVESEVLAENEDDASEDIITEDVSEEDADTNQIDLSDPASVTANWEIIPAGTIIDASVIDFNNLSQYFVAYEISDEVFSFINEKSYQENPDVALSDLRYMKLLHYNFNHELQVGELIVAADLQSDFIGIFTELFQAEYEIQSMYLPDNYWTGDPTSTDSASIDVNNTSCFMYRPATGSGNLSKHAYGRAIDINPQQNPYVSYTSGSPKWSHENANDYIDRTTGLPHVITEEDICYQVFTKYGFTWGGSWANVKDYQHFQK